MAKETNKKNYVLVVDYEGDTDILQLCYDTKWNDVAVLLQVKYELDQLPRFTYLNDDEDEILLDSQVEFEAALKVCQKNEDVLHIKVHPRSANIPIRKTTEERNIPAQTAADGLSPQSPIQSGIAWASKAVKQAVHGIGQGLISISKSESLVSMEEIDFQKFENMQSEKSSLACNTEEDRSDRNQDVSSISEPNTAINNDLPLSSATAVKQPVVVVEDIEVPTSFEDEVCIKMPVVNEKPGTSQEANEKDTRESEMLNALKQEVQLVINKEMSVLREEVRNHILEINSSKSPEVSDDSLNQLTRTPKAIKREIHQLRKEMKVAKLQKRQKKQKFLAKAQSGVEVPQEMQKVRKYAASFICDNLLDGSCVGVGQQFTKYWVLKNDGKKAWDHTIKLELLKETPSSFGSPVDPNEEQETPKFPRQGVNSWGPEKYSIDLPIVNQNETAVIAVRHTAPPHTCSYTSSWRLQRKGKFFGPRIWCSVSVTPQQLSLTSMDSQPPSTIFTTDDEPSLVQSRPDWFQQRQPSQRDEPTHDDDLSNMLSFEMADVGRDIGKSPNISSADQQNKASFEFEQLPSISESQKHETSLREEDRNEEEENKENDAVAMQENTQESELPAEVVQPDLPVEKPDQENLSTTPSTADHEYNEVVEEIHDHKERDEVKDRLRDEQFSSDSSSSSDEESSEVSDFEVIPLPECFDITRPMSGSEKGDSLNVADKKDAETEEKAEDNNEPALEKESENEEKTADGQMSVESQREPEELKDQEQEPQNTVEKYLEQEPQNAVEKSVEKTAPPSEEEKPGPSTSSSIPASVISPKSIPQSVLDMDQAYPMEPQKVVTDDIEAWASQPIALPRSVVNQDEAWMPDSQAPVPQPRASQSSGLSTETSDTDSDSEEISVPVLQLVEPPARDVLDEEEDSPRILYPPVLENEGEEFHLAPQDPQYPSHTYNPSPIEQLIEMGFTDISLNEDVLREFEGDVNQAVQALVYRGEEEETRLRERHHYRNGRNRNGEFIA